MTLLPFAKSFGHHAKFFKKGSPFSVTSARNLMSKHLIYSCFGDPLDVVKIRESTVPKLDTQDVLVRMLAAPVNPADLNTIQGKYPVEIELPSIPGNEGVGIIEDIGTSVSGLRRGEKVILRSSAQGTWRNFGIFHHQSLRAVPQELGIVEAATLTVNPCTAYRMLTDFIPVREKNLVVIQNGANSACGQNVIQLCKAWGIRNINIVRNRSDISELKSYLEGLGATYVLTEEELRKTTIFKDGSIDKPSLALNCIGGKNALEMLRHLEHSGCMVTYGGMSKEPVLVPTSAFIFKNIALKGFWMTLWNKQADKAQQDKMISELIELMCDKQLKGPVHEMIKLDDYSKALGKALCPQGFTGCKNAFLPTLPTVPGDEGVGEVVEIGKHVGRVKIGDKVVLASPLQGTWRYYGIFNQRSVHVIPPKLPLPEAAMLTIAPCTAYRLLRDFRHVRPGETVIQNAANSPVGQSVIQLCKAWDIKTLNVVANHTGYDDIKRYLYAIGATHVYTLEEAEEICDFTTSVKRPVLALNCLGGRFEDVMLKILQRNCSAAMVYYGNAYDLPMSKQFLRHDVTFAKFHLTNFNISTGFVVKDAMIKDIIQQMIVGHFLAPINEPIELKNYTHALRNTSFCDAFATKSYIFDFTL